MAGAEYLGESVVVRYGIEETSSAEQDLPPPWKRRRQNVRPLVAFVPIPLQADEVRA